MIVNGKEYKIDDLIESVDTTSSQMNKIGTFFLSNKEMEILDRNYIDYRTSATMHDLMMKIQNILEDEDLDADDGDDLDWVLEQISERNYYANTNK